MINAEIFVAIFGIYATELWAKPEKEFLEWLNAEARDFTDDCISRKSVISVIDKQVEDLGPLDGYQDELELKQRILKLPPVIPKTDWIPVSERLPDEGGKYLVTCEIYYTPDHVDERDHRKGIEIMYYDKEYGQGFSNNEVYAWMPLPKLWEGAKEEVRVGDIVEIPECGERAVVLKVGIPCEQNIVHLLNHDGTSEYRSKDSLKITGKCVDIDDILEQIRSGT